jgi:hypothetical protein
MNFLCIVRFHLSDPHCVPKADTNDNSTRLVDYLSPLRKNATTYGKTIWKKEKKLKEWGKQL